MMVAATAVAAGAAGCGRSDLFSARRCPPGNAACQMQSNQDGGVSTLDGGGRGGNGGNDGSGRGGNGGGRGGNGGNGGAGGRADAGRDVGPPPPPPPPPDAGVDRNRCPTGNREICGNGADDDCNLLSDCADPACQGDRACMRPGQEVCNNGLDDDDDRMIDCADPDCATNVACRPVMGREICDNGFDDNNDRLTDCSDPQCVAFPACVSLNCTADVDFGPVAAHGATVTRAFDTRGATRGFTTCAPSGGHGRVGRFTLAAAADVKVDVSQGAGAAHVVALFRAGTAQACDANPAGCLSAGGAPRASQTFAGLGAGTYWVIVESFPGTEGAATVTLSTGTAGRMEICANGIDDDGNGLTDCQDLACQMAPSCAASTCNADVSLGALIVDAPAKMLRVDLTSAPSRYRPTCAGMVPGGDTAIAFTLAEAGGVEVGYNQTGHTIFSMFRMPGPGEACDAEQIACAFEEQRANAVAFSEQPAGRYLLILKAVSNAEAGVLNLRISTFRNRRVEVCGNGIDDDANGLADCDDPACFGVGNCSASACRPDFDLGALAPNTQRSAMLDTRSGRDLYQTVCGRGDGKEQVVRVSLTQPMALGIECTDGGSHVLELSQQLAPLDACNAHELSCADPEVLPFGCGFSIPGLQPGQYNLIVEAFQSGREGPLALTLFGVPETIREVCDNGIDDDRDGATDCADLKCVTSPTCEKFACRADKTLGLLPLDGSVSAFVIQTSMSGDDQTKTACVSAPGGQDGVVDFQLPAKADVKIDWAQVGSHDLALYTDDGPLLSCEAGRALACIASGGAATGSRTLAGLAAGKYHLVVDADRTGVEGGVALQLSATASP